MLVKSTPKETKIFGIFPCWGFSSIGCFNFPNYLLQCRNKKGLSTVVNTGKLEAFYEVNFQGRILKLLDLSVILDICRLCMSVMSYLDDPEVTLIVEFDFLDVNFLAYAVQ